MSPMISPWVLSVPSAFAITAVQWGHRAFLSDYGAGHEAILILITEMRSVLRAALSADAKWETSGKRLPSSQAHGKPSLTECSTGSRLRGPHA